MICKNCQAQVDGGAAFCPKCGQSTQASCPRCRNPVPDGDRFCKHCGMPLDGSRLCGACGAVVSAEAEFCPKCGTAKDGRRKCTDCGAVLEPDCRFCPACGKPCTVSTPKSSPVHGQKTASGGVKTLLYQLIRRWAVVGLMAAMFILSFFGMLKLPMDAMDIPDVSVRGTDLVAGMFRLINPPTAEKAEADFKAYVKKHYKEDKSPSDYLSDYGPLRLMITKEAMEDNVAVKIQIVLWSLLQLAIWGVLLGFLIAETVSAVKYTLSRKESASRGSLAFALQFILPLCFVPLAGALLAGPAVTVLILAACGIAGLAVCRYTVEKQPLRLKPLLAQGVGFTLVLIAVAITCANSLGFDLMYSQGSTIISATGWGTFWDTAAQINRIDTNTLTVEAYFDTIVAALKNMSQAPLATLTMLVSAAFMPALLPFFKNTDAFLAGYMIMGILMFLVILLFAVAAAFCLLKNVRSLADGKKRSTLVWDIILLAASVAMLVATIVTIAMSNSIANQVINGAESGTDRWLQYFLAAMPIVLVVFAGLNLAKTIVFLIIDRPKQTLQIPASPSDTVIAANTHDDIQPV